MRKRFDELPVIKMELMETNSERRRRKLTELCLQRGLKNVAGRAGLNPATLDQIIKGVTLPPKKDGSTSLRSLGDEAARKIEDGENLGRGWFDESATPTPASVTNITPPFKQTPTGKAGFIFAGNFSASKKIEVAGMAKIGAEGFFDELAPEAGVNLGVVEANSEDPAAYALLVRGDAGFPAVRDGEYIVIEPHLTAAPTERVIIVLNDGRTMLQELLVSRPESITVVSLDGSTRRTIQRSEIRPNFGIQVVTSIQSPRKWGPA